MTEFCLLVLGVSLRRLHVCVTQHVWGSGSSSGSSSAWDGSETELRLWLTMMKAKPGRWHRLRWVKWMMQLLPVAPHLRFNGNTLTMAEEAADWIIKAKNRRQTLSCCFHGLMNEASRQLRHKLMTRCLTLDQNCFTLLYTKQRLKYYTLQLRALHFRNKRFFAHIHIEINSFVSILWNKTCLKVATVEVCWPYMHRCNCEQDKWGR